MDISKKNVCQLFARLHNLEENDIMENLFEIIEQVTCNAYEMALTEEPAEILIEYVADRCSECMDACATNAGSEAVN